MAFDFIQKLPDGINTNFGDIGGILSGGQKQRIVLARAVLRKPDLLILDEATSALDSKNEKKVQEAIENVSREYKMTTVIIAHRLSTIKNASTIYVLDKGQIIEEGTHNNLIELNKTYAKFYKSQQSAMDAIKRLKENVNLERLDDNLSSEESVNEERNYLKEFNIKKNLNSEEKDFSLYEISSGLLPYSKPYYYIIVVFFGSIIVGAWFSCAAIPVVKAIFKLSGKETKHEKWAAIWHSNIVFAGQIAVVLVVYTWSKYFIRRVTDKLTINMRAKAFTTLVNQPIQFFDSKSNSIGSLVGMLSSDIRHLNGASVEIYLLVFQGIAGMIAGIIICFAYCWRIAVLVLPIIPLFSIGATVQYKLQFTSPNKTKTSSRKQFSMVSDWIMNYQTIASLAYEDEYLSKYGVKPLENVRAGASNTKDISMLSALVIGITYGISQVTLLVLYSVGILGLAERIDSGESPTNTFTSVNASFFGGFVLWNALANAPNFGKGKAVAAKILKIISSPNEGSENSSIIDGDQILTKEAACQEIKFTNVWFKYPLENSRWVLRNFNLTIKPNQWVGLIGESGSGKSTIVQLLLRFYDHQDGEITIGGVNIKSFTLKSLRSVFGLVQQEPILFNTSIMENIIYGKSDANSEEIKRAAEIANAHQFIWNLDSNIQSENNKSADIKEDRRYESLDPGYKTLWGSKGSKLSGGQKQRIAIARALVRDPPILLLDEATSALDEKSQQEVQLALDNFIEKKTWIIIAHRTSTLQKWDVIYEISEGIILNKA